MTTALSLADAVLFLQSLAANTSQPPLAATSVAVQLYRAQVNQWCAEGDSLIAMTMLRGENAPVVEGLDAVNITTHWSVDEVNARDSDPRYAALHRVWALYGQETESEMLARLARNPLWQALTEGGVIEKAAVLAAMQTLPAGTFVDVSRLEAAIASGFVEVPSGMTREAFQAWLGAEENQKHDRG